MRVRARLTSCVGRPGGDGIHVTWADLIQQPYFYAPSAMSIHPLLARELVEVRCRGNHPYYEYRALMLEPPADYGAGLVETGENRGMGTSFDDPALALTKSVFEAFERKWSKVWDPDALQVASFAELGDSGAVSPESFGVVTDWEFGRDTLPYVRYTPELPLAWTGAHRVSPGVTEPVLLPAALCYARYGWKEPHERFAPTLSAGLAAHTSYSAAFLEGLYELIERDAFMVTWLHRNVPSHVDPASVDFDEATFALAHIEELGFVPHFLNLTTDAGVPVVATVLEHPRLAWEGTLVPGLGCALDPVAALKKSLLEALAMLANVVTYDADTGHLEPVPHTRVHGISRAEYYRAARFLVEGATQIGIGDIPNADRYDPGRNLEAVLQSLEAADMTAYLVDLTPPEADPARLVLVRALVAGLQPMVYESDCWRFVERRVGTPDFGRLNLAPNLLMATL